MCLEQRHPQAWIIVPARNEGAVIRQTVTELRKMFMNVVVVDDGSSDATAENARAAGAFIIRHLVNLGQGAALDTGLRFALQHPTAELFVTFDADGQHRPLDALKMIQVQMESGCSVVLGTRFSEPTRNILPLAKRVLLPLARYHVNRVSGLRLTDAHNGLRVMSREAAAMMQFQQRGMAHATEAAQILGRSGLSFCEVPITVNYTEHSLRNGQPLLNAVNILFEQYWRP